MTDQPRPLADIAREAVQRAYLDHTGMPLAAATAEALIEAAFDAIGDAAVRHLSVVDPDVARGATAEEARRPWQDKGRRQA